MDFHDDKEVVATFIEETTERTRQIENGLLGIEKNAFRYDDAEIHGMFRSAHSIKAAANLLELASVEKLSHRMEYVLQGLRKRQITPDENLISTLLETLDAIRDLIDDIGNEAGHDVSRHLENLEALLPEGFAR